VPETERVFQNLSAVLKVASKSFDDVARAGVFLTNMTDFASTNGIYAKYFSQPFPPARRSRLPRYHLGSASRSISLSRPEAAAWRSIS
jgi:enamine deaminase RidA (YjgF/YER057c/UK114 family)